MPPNTPNTPNTPETNPTNVSAPAPTSSPSAAAQPTTTPAPSASTPTPTPQATPDRSLTAAFTATWRDLTMRAALLTIVFSRLLALLTTYLAVHTPTSQLRAYEANPRDGWHLVPLLLRRHHPHRTRRPHLHPAQHPRPVSPPPPHRPRHHYRHRPPLPRRRHQRLLHALSPYPLPPLRGRARHSCRAYVLRCITFTCCVCYSGCFPLLSSALSLSDDLSPSLVSP